MMNNIAQVYLVTVSNYDTFYTTVCKGEQALSNLICNLGEGYEVQNIEVECSVSEFVDDYRDICGINQDLELGL